MRRVIVVQARTTSTRLPGKVLMDLAGRPMLAQQLLRLKRCRLADEIVVATTTNATDDRVVALARAAGVRWFRGSERDVLERYVGAVRDARADVVVRVTADCPLIDSDVSDRVIDALSGGSMPSDYASNVTPRTYPQGLDTEALFADTLERVHRMARSESAREHVTTFIYREHPDLFLVQSVTDQEDNSDLRWTVDEAADLELVRRLYDALGVGERAVGYRELLAYARAHPELSALNRTSAARRT
jgi:spore coat polysaccharide biosynthesis protein SpsF